MKKKIHLKQTGVFCNAREIWWVSIGLNVGSEEDGKNELFERPVLIVKVFNKEMIRVVPITSTKREDANHLFITNEDMTGSLKFSQLKTISTRRLSRKVCRVNSHIFLFIINRLKDSIA